MSVLEFHTFEQNWSDLPLHQVLYEWILKNMSAPMEVSTIVAYVGLFLISWYVIVWVTRFLVTIVWPLFLIASGVIVFRVLQFYEPQEIVSIAMKSLTIMADTLVRARFFYKYTLHQSIRIYKNIQDCILVFYYFLFGVDEQEKETEAVNIPDMFEPDEILHIN